jgi:dihydroxy-acid dehydratase
MAQKLNRYSSRITQPKSQGASQAMLYGTGMTEADMDKAQVGIASVWWEGNTCNMHLNDLAAEVKKGVVAADLVGLRFNTIGVSDGISMGTDGMSYSLQSREIIADSIESVMGAQWYDGLIALPGCDKNMPGTVIAMGRLNRPSIMIYGGTIKPGHSHGRTLDIVSAFPELRRVHRRTRSARRSARTSSSIPAPAPAPAAACTPPTPWPR